MVFETNLKNGAWFGLDTANLWAGMLGFAHQTVLLWMRERSSDEPDRLER